MKIAWKLAFAYAVHHPARMILTSVAMIASACVVVWVVSGYDALASKFGDTAQEYLGRYDLFVVPDSTDEAFLSPDFIAQLKEDSDIAQFEPVMQTVIRVQPDSMRGLGMGIGGRGRPGMGGPGTGPGKASPPGQPEGKQGPPPGRQGGTNAGKSTPPRPRMMFGMSPNLVGTSAKEPPYKLAEGRWITHGDPALREAVISNLSAEQLNVKTGDEVLAIFGTKEYRLKIVGVTEQVAAQPLQEKSGDTPTGRPVMRQRQGSALGPAAAALYVPMPLAEKIAKRSNKINFINIKLKNAADAAKFRQRWAAASAKTSPAALIVGNADIKAAMEEGMMANNAKKQAWAATGMSLLAALFIIFTTLSMGVNERVRQFAMMRAVGLTRMQVACVVTAESFFLALIGWGGGLAAGWGLLALMSNNKPELFGNTPTLGLWCVLLTGVSALGGALAASIIPAWQATGVEPLEALSPRHPVRPSLKLSLILAAIGLLLISVNPLLVFKASIPDTMRYGIYEAIGCSSMAVGFLLLAPMAIIAIEHLLGPIFAAILRLEPKLLSSQLSGNLWRTLGTTVALTIGLGLYVSMMVWGYTMLQPFKPGKWVPDVLAVFQLGGLPDGEIEAVRNIPGVIPEKCIPLAVDQPRLADDITQSEQGNSVTRQDNVIIIGLDPEVAFGGSDPLIKAQFTDGSAAEAIAKLKEGRYCIVPDHFLAATGLCVGDRFAMIPPENPEKPIEYAIAGAVSLPGWHWMTKFSGLRRRSGRSAAMVFAPYEQVRRDFELKHLNFFWMDIDKNVGVEKVGTAMQAIADRNLGESQPVNGQGTWAGGAQMFGQSLRISTPEEVRERIMARADAWIWALCELPLITLLVTSLGVVNTIAASVRARRWELGVMRAIGVTREALFRMILVEGLLIGLVACALSLAFGVMAGWCGTGISQYVSFFGGMATPLFVPWMKLSLGFGITMALCLIASLWPAISTGYAEPLKLLQEGRTSL